MGTGKYVKQLAGESVVYGISGTISRFIGVFLIPVYTRVFTPADYGVIALVDTVTTLLGIFVVLGLDNSSARWFYDTKDTDHRKCTIASWFWCQLAVATLAGIILFIFAGQVSFALFRSERYASLLRLAAATLPLGTFARVVGNWFRYQRRAWSTAIFTTISSVGTIGLTILLVVLWRWGLKGAFGARLLAAAITAIASVVILKGWIAPTWFSWACLKAMLLYGLPLVPAGIASWVKLSSNRLILQMFCGETEVGLFAIAGSLSSAVGLFTGAFQLAWAPFAYSILPEEHSGQVYAKVLEIYAFLGASLCVGISLFSTGLLGILTTKDYYAASSCVPFLAYAFVFNGAFFIAALGAGIAKKSVLVAKGIFVEAIATLLLSFTLVPWLGKEGAAVASAVSSLLAVLYLFRASQKAYHIPYRFQPALICLGFSWLVIAADRWGISAFSLQAYMMRGVLLLLFVPLAMLLGVIRWRDVKVLLRISLPRRHNAVALVKEPK